MIWAGAVMIWAGAVMIWAGACSNTNFPTLKLAKNAEKAKCDRPTDRWTDRRTDRPTRWLIGRVPATKKSLKFLSGQFLAKSENLFFLCPGRRQRRRILFLHTQKKILPYFFSFHSCQYEKLKKIFFYFCFTLRTIGIGMLMTDLNNQKNFYIFFQFLFSISF